MREVIREVIIDGIRFSGELDFTRLLDFRLTAGVNEHAILEVLVCLEGSLQDDADRWTGKKVRLGTLFAGRIESFELSFCNQECRGRFWCVSVSKDLDREKKSRSFQDIHMSCQEMMDRIAGKGKRILFLCQGQSLGKPWIQWEETDWEFCRRIASRFGSVVIPEITGYDPQVSIGFFEGRTYTIENSRKYKAFCDIERYEREKTRQKCRLDEFWTYRVREEREFDLGQSVQFLEQRLRVLEKKVFLEHGHVEREYLLGTETAAGLPPFDNSRLRGLSLPGTVRWRGGEKLKVQLDLDEGREAESGDLYGFEYMPVSGNLFYALPEEGARVRLYFPDGREEHGMITESMAEEIVFPESEEKVFQTKEGKRGEWGPEAMEYGSLIKRMKISISDPSGVEIDSERRIRLSARGTVLLSAGGYVSCDAPQGYHFEDRGTRDYLDIRDNEMVFSTSKAVIGALPHPLRNCMLHKERRGANPMRYADRILGGIPQGHSLTVMEAMVLGGIPVYVRPGRAYDREDLVFLGTRRQ